MREVICEAIRAMRLLVVRYRDTERVVEPYLLFETKDGTLVLHSWQVEGGYQNTPPPDWCNLRLSEISSVMPLDRTYAAPHEGYNPGGKMFHKVVCRA